MSTYELLRKVFHIKIFVFELHGISLENESKMLKSTIVG